MTTHADLISHLRTMGTEDRTEISDALETAANALAEVDRSATKAQEDAGPSRVTLAARRGGKTRSMIDAILAQANERGVELTIVTPEETTDDREALARVIDPAIYMNINRLTGDSWKASLRAADAILAAGFRRRPTEPSGEAFDAAAILDAIRAWVKDRWHDGLLQAPPALLALLDASPAAHLTSRDAEKWDEGRQAWGRYITRCEDADAAGWGVNIEAPVNPYRTKQGEAKRMTCPGCGHEVYLDPLDGWRNDSDGFTCEPPRTTHSQHIVGAEQGEQA